MPDVRLIDANALIKDIAESIKLADEWEAESHKKQDKHGLKCAIDTRRALLAMISRVKDAPTIEAQPVKRGKWEVKGGVHCTRCGWRPSGRVCDLFTNFCAGCGADMRGDKK